MTATLEQTQSDLLRLVNLVQQGEEVIITNRLPWVSSTGLTPFSEVLIPEAFQREIEQGGVYQTGKRARV